jgi:hypothetical protein
MGATGRQFDALKNAYRTTFWEYSARLEALQRLMNSGTPENASVDAASVEVEKARVAYNSARDRLAIELVRPSTLPGSGNEHRVRETAQLLWEMAGRPDGTAEGDWQKAEQLVHSAGSAS